MEGWYNDLYEERDTPYQSGRFTKSPGNPEQGTPKMFVLKFGYRSIPYI